eukprot:scaffold425162_cov18-Prasinocladus_malaysianus.AAC.1
MPKQSETIESCGIDDVPVGAATRAAYFWLLAVNFMPFGFMNSTSGSRAVKLAAEFCEKDPAVRSSIK